MKSMLKRLTESTKSAVMLDGLFSELFNIEQGFSQGSMYIFPKNVSVCIDDNMLKVVEAIGEGAEAGTSLVYRLRTTF